MAQRSVQERLSRATHYIDGSGVNYVENPKVACSNIKWSLINKFRPNQFGEIQRIHDRRETPFVSSFSKIVSIYQEKKICSFSLVRHPRKRFLSAYFDKMHEGRDQSVWNLIAEQIDLKKEQIYEPKIILDRLIKSPQQDLDPHVAKQIINLFWGHINYDKVFYLEELNRSNASISVMNNNIDIVDRQGHSTSPRLDMGLFDEEALEMIDVMYSDDYHAFGYIPKENDPMHEIIKPCVSVFFSNFLASKTPVKFLIKFFEDGPKELSYLECGAVIDVLSQRGIWHRVPHRILDFLIVRNVTRKADNVTRFVERFTGFPGSV